MILKHNRHPGNRVPLVSRFFGVRSDLFLACQVLF